MGGIYCEIKLEPCIEYSPCWNGVCKREYNFNYQSNFTCECSLGYTGQFCEKHLIETNICDSKPCKNNGKCILKSDDTFECLCEAEFEGDLCELNIKDEFKIFQRFRIKDCRYRGCENNGTCAIAFNTKNFNNEHECHCVPGFSGRFCELDINECLLSKYLFFTNF